MGAPVSEAAASLPSPPDSRTSRSPADSTPGDVGAGKHVNAPSMSTALSLDHLSDLESSPEPPAIVPRAPVPPVPSRGGTLDQAISLDSDESSDDEIVLVSAPPPVIRRITSPVDALAPEVDVKPRLVASPSPVDPRPSRSPQTAPPPLQGSSARPLTCTTCRTSDSAIWANDGDGRPVCDSCSTSQSAPRLAVTIPTPSSGPRAMARKSAKMTPRKLPTGGTAVGTPRSPLTRPPVVDAPPDYIPPAPLPRPPSPRLPSPARSSPERPLAGIARKRAPDDSPSALDLRAPKRARTGPLASQARLDLLAHADRRPPSPPPLPSGMILPHDWTLGAGVVVPAVAPQRMASANRALGQTSSAASIGGGGKQRFLLARPSSVSHKRSRSSSVAVGSSPFKAVAALPPKTFVQQREEMWEDALEARITPHRRVYAPDPDDPIADPWTEGVTSHDHNDRPAPKNAFIGPDRFRYGYPVIRTPVQLRVAARPLDDVLPLYDPAEPRPQHRLQPRPSVITWAQFALHHADKVVVATATAEAARGHGPVVTATAEAVAERPAEAASAALVAASTAAADACS